MNWGPNCARKCSECSANTKTCDRVKGCICATGWTGASCSQDINECDQTSICGDLEDCKNSFGSYECVCKTGYKKGSDGTCQGNVFSIIYYCLPHFRCFIFS